MRTNLGLVMNLALLMGPTVTAQRYLDMRHHSYREMKEYMQLIKATCPSKYDVILGPSNFVIG